LRALYGGQAGSVARRLLVRGRRRPRLPFSDASGGTETYGGGRHLYDTIKGAGLGIAGAEILLDFNLPTTRRVRTTTVGRARCRLLENRLPFAVTAGSDPR
jgi:uncharacterized protein (DUF1684 family)